MAAGSRGQGGVLADECLAALRRKQDGGFLLGTLL
jgi:hypothetical protein